MLKLLIIELKNFKSLFYLFNLDNNKNILRKYYSNNMPLFRALSSVKDKLTLTPNELLIKEATSNEDITVSTGTLYQVADLTFHPSEFSRVMEAIWISVGSPRIEWRKIQRGLILADIVMKFGSARCVQELRDYTDRIKHLQEFKYSDEDGDRGGIIREKARYLLEILPDFSKIDRERELAKKQKNKCVGLSRDDVYRGNYKKHSSQDDVRGGISDRREAYEGRYEQSFKEVPKAEVSSKPPQIEEQREIQSPKIEIRPQPPQVEERKSTPAPYFEQIRFDSNPNPSLPPNYNAPQTTAPIQQMPPGYNASQNIVPIQQTPPIYNAPQAFAPQNYPPPSQNYPPPHQNYPPPPQNYSPAPQNYTSPPQNYSPAPQNYTSPPPQNYPPASQNYPPAGYSGNYPIGNPQYSYNQAPFTNVPQMNPYSANPNTYPNNFNPISQNNPGNYNISPNLNYPPQNKPAVKHNLPDMRSQAAPVVPKAEKIDLESQLMNLDGLEFSLSNNKKQFS